ncbi:putative helicase mov-10-B.1 [Megachile rotundata]|uniref:putative helicase mov-10-B.1 n=1 Tax=Megachile rotundata TaxID=143995 RepID=UPI00061521C2|nr:PREDICTED: putative helicase mov-10-B.1 [Megachile rotundata]XP_012151886.1 PREDICTED: putative helicase mov-10-B.1 [Megachile rotundata]XP_012151887.1 PREDICTED: putative helicase mov-10-B.1 [Megachile rotundata]XP_012151888.1 PREDICTED: putative helicase mov-10-B.1 [Megachile rotundata]
MKDQKSKVERSTVARSTHCTSYGVCDLLPLDEFEPPMHIKMAIRNHSVEYSTNNQLQGNYIKLINNFLNMNKIGAEHYLIFFKILLYMEDHEIQLIAAEHNLINQDIKEISNIFVFTVPTLDETDPFISIGDMVKLQTTSSKYICCGKIVNIEAKDIYVSVREYCSKKLLGDTVNVYFFPANWPIKCFHYVLHHICKHNLTNLLFPKVNTIFHTSYTQKIDWVNQSVANNPEQKMAVMNILNNSAYPAPFILFGPPGTGKTATLVEAICQIRKQYKTKNILVCTSSNAAADEITKRLLTVLPCKDVFRMYAPSKPWTSLDKNIDPASNFIDNSVLFLPKEIFILKKIVITTLVNCIRLVALNLQKDHFSYIFIDEASQCIELESLIPFTLASSENKIGKGILHAQIIIAGDPYQLGPVVRCKKIEHLLGKSIIERLMECEPYQKVNNKYNSRYIIKLIRNYRSREAILRVPNELFYDNELLCNIKNDTNKITLNWKELAYKTFPIIFFAINGEEMRTENGSVYNKQEVKAIINYTRKLVYAKIGVRKIEPKDIGIITPFRQQKFMIEQNLKRYKLTDITVGTVETFQGQEREVILLTTVRSKVFQNNGKQHIGFLSNPKRFNVALTRAKSLLIIIGNPATLCKDKNWNVLWQYCKKNNACSIIEVIP